MLLPRCIQTYIHHMEEENRLSRTTLENYAYELKRLLHFFEERETPLDPQAITYEHIRTYIQWLKEERGYKPASIRRVLSIIRTFFNFLIRTGACGLRENPTRHIPAVPAQRKLPQILSAAESRKFLLGIKKASSFPARDYAIFLLFLQACCRLQELQQLKLGSINLREGYVDIDGQGGQRRVPLTTEGVRALSDYLEVRRHMDGSDRLFVSPRGTPMSKGGIGCLFKSLAKKTGVYREGLSVHKLRHTCLALKLQEGVKIAELQSIAGHANPSSTHIYRRVVELEQVRQRAQSVGES